MTSHLNDMLPPELMASAEQADFGDWGTWVGAFGTILAFLVAVVIAVGQLKTQRRQLAVERTIAAHKDMTSGEAGAARDRLSEFMWREGSSVGTNSCWQPSWEQLLGAGYLEIPNHVRDLSKYPEDIATSCEQTPLRDLYKIFWQFERVGAAYHSGLLDDRLALQMIASHVVWWDSLCARIESDKTRYRRPLAELAKAFKALDSSLTTWAQADFCQAQQDQQDPAEPPATSLGES